MRVRVKLDELVQVHVRELNRVVSKQVPRVAKVHAGNGPQYPAVFEPHWNVPLVVDRANVEATADVLLGDFVQSVGHVSVCLQGVEGGAAPTAHFFQKNHTPILPTNVIRLRAVFFSTTLCQ